MPEPRGTDIGGGVNGASDQDAAGTGTGAGFTGHAGRMASCVTGIGSTPGVTPSSCIAPNQHADVVTQEFNRISLTLAGLGLGPHRIPKGPMRL